MSRVFARKRMINESLKDSWMIHGIQYFATENLIYIPIYNKFTTESGLLSVKLKECHPWRPPDVFLAVPCHTSAREPTVFLNIFI